MLSALLMSRIPAGRRSVGLRRPSKMRNVLVAKIQGRADCGGSVEPRARTFGRRVVAASGYCGNVIFLDLDFAGFGRPTEKR
jgi:hypothetical protein